MTATSHLQTAAGLLDRTDRAIESATSNTIAEVQEQARLSIAAATAHALIACGQLLGEISDRLNPPISINVDKRGVATMKTHADQLVTAADLLERLAVGGDDQERQETVRRLVCHRQRPYRNAAAIAHDALVAAAQSDDGRLSGRVQQAIVLLGIEVPE